MTNLERNIDAYKNKAKAQLSEWNADFDRFRAKAAEASADVRSEIERELSELGETRDAALRKLDQLGDASADQMADAKAEVDKVWADMKSGLDKVKRRIN